MMIQKIGIVLLLVLPPAVRAQDSTAGKKLLPFEISGYLETYYSYDMGQPDHRTKPDFFYSFNRHNEFNLNLGYIKLSYADSGARGNLAFMGGTYAQYNLAAEPGLLKNIFEANAGLKLSRRHNIWLDAGIFSSHIGFESAVGKDCWNLTRSILADNSPYYEAGAKLGYTTPSGRWFLSVLLLNGWQKIQGSNGMQSPSFGTQITHKGKNKRLFNWSTYIGRERPDSSLRLRVYNNLYALFHLTHSLSMIAGFDIGIQEKPRSVLYIVDGFSLWYSPVAVIRLKTSSKTHLAARVESFTDKDGVVIAAGNQKAFNTTGYSLNFDIQTGKQSLFRLEGRYLRSKEAIFTLRNSASVSNLSATAALALSF